MITPEIHDLIQEKQFESAIIVGIEVSARVVVVFISQPCISPIAVQLDSLRCQTD